MYDPRKQRKLSAPCPTDEGFGFRTIELWESEQAWESFQAKRLAPAIAALARPARPEPTFRGLRVAHVVVGTAIAEWKAPCASFRSRENSISS